MKKSLNLRQAMDAVQGGARLAIDSDAMGRASYRILTSDGVYSITRTVGAQMPLTQMKCVQRDSSCQVWQAR